MRKTVFAAAMLFAGLAGGTAQADPYKWCAEYGNRGGGATNCYFRTIGQCQAAISGNGGFCRRNTFYTGEERNQRGYRAYGMDRRW